jgi:hypothetical protein
MKSLETPGKKVWLFILMGSVLTAAFIAPVIPAFLHKTVFQVVLTVIYFAAIFALKNRSKYTVMLFIATLLLEWISAAFNFEILHTIAKVANIAFFLVVVILLIWQIAAARHVNTEVIMGSVIGYLLLGIVFSIFISFILIHDPAAFSKPASDPTAAYVEEDRSIPIYISFVTLATLGYGDIVPQKPYSRSLMTLVAISGQFYIAIIVAMLVGKFASRRD